MKLVNNAFSTKMLKANATVDINILTEKEFMAKAKQDDGVSVIGHEDTANLFGFEFNRQSVVLDKGDVLFVVEMNNEEGTRLPIGITEINQLPDGVWFRFLEVVVK